MRSGFKRMLAAMLIAAMTIIPTFSSFAAETFVPEFSPFAGFWPGFGFGMASPSNMIPGFIPGMDQGFWINPQDPSGNFPGIVPPADMEDAYDIYAESVDETGTYASTEESEAEEDVINAESEAEEDIINAETETEDAAYAEDDNWTIVDDEDSGNGDYVKPQVYTIDGKASSDALLTDYIDRLFYGEPDTTIYTDYWRSVLNSDEKNLYDDIKEFAREIAAADEVYPVFNAAGTAPAVRLTKSQLGLSDDTKNIAWCEATLDYYIQNVLNVSRIINYLYRDDPSCFYWADRSYMVLYDAAVEDDCCTITPSSIYFPPQSDWEGDYAGRLGSYEIVNVDNEDILTAAKAAENAREIVEDHIDEQESEMMASFEEAITAVISYDSAGYADSSEYDDPWMLVYVFDKDPLTTVTDIAAEKALLCLRGMSGIDNAGSDSE